MPRFDRLVRLCRLLPIRYPYLLLPLLCLGIRAHPQNATPRHSEDSASKHLPTVTIHGFVEGYYGIDTDEPKDHVRPLLFNFNRANEFNLNLGYLEVAGVAERYRFKFTPALGTYMLANYALEPLGLQYIYEANAGIKLSRNKEIWLDVGVLSSPIDYENAVSVLHNTLTRSLATEGIPYYLAGARLGMALTDKLQLNLYAVNGWQVIRETNHAKSGIWQIQYRPWPKLLLNYTGYIGDESPDLNKLGRAYRFYQDAYLVYDPSPRWNIVALFDIGQQNGFGEKRSQYWHTANLTARFKINQTFKLGMRAEYFADPHLVKVTGLGEDADIGGASVDLGYQIDDHIVLRIESRILASDRKEFTNVKGKPVPYVIMNTASLAAYF